MDYDDAFAAEQDVKPAIAKPPANGSGFTKPHSLHLIAMAAAATAHRGVVCSER
jgi:hypothetical protein